MEYLKEVEGVLNRVGTLEMQHDRSLAGGLGIADRGDRTCDPELVPTSPINLKPFRHHCHGGAEALERSSRREQRVDSAGDNIR